MLGSRDPVLDHYTTPVVCAPVWLKSVAWHPRGLYWIERNGALGEREWAPQLVELSRSLRHSGLRG